jgi:non-homologous end joining protein Ku
VEVQDAPLRRSVVEEIDQDLEATEAEEPAPPARLENDYKIAIERFVPRSQIDPAYFEKAYYIVPRELVGQEAFAVVRDAMGEKGMVALGQYASGEGHGVLNGEAFGSNRSGGGA